MIFLIYIGNKFPVYFWCLPNFKQKMHGFVPKEKDGPRENQQHFVSIKFYVYLHLLVKLLTDKPELWKSMQWFKYWLKLFTF